MRIEGLPEDAVVETSDGVPVDRKPGMTKRSPPTQAVLVSVADPPRVLRIKAGGRVAQVPAKRFVGAGWIILDILMGVVPLIVDAGTGSWYEYEDALMPSGTAAVKR